MLSTLPGMASLMSNSNSKDDQKAIKFHKIDKYTKKTEVKFRPQFPFKWYKNKKRTKTIKVRH